MAVLLGASACIIDATDDDDSSGDSSNATTNNSANDSSGSAPATSTSEANTDTAAPGDEIAVRSGYEDPSAMTRAFRHKFGAAPLAMRLNLPD